MINSAAATPTTLPPAYTPVDISTGSGQLAKKITDEIALNFENSDGTYDTPKLIEFLSILSRSIEHKTGVSLPSVNSARIEANNNPTNPDLWDWDRWETQLFPLRDSYYRCRFKLSNAINKILGVNIGKCEDKVLNLLQQDSFKSSLIGFKKIEDYEVKHMVRSARDASNIFEELFRTYTVTGNLCKPTGVIRAAIELGYLPKKDIDSLFKLAETSSQ